MSVWGTGRLGPLSAPRPHVGYVLLLRPQIQVLDIPARGVIAVVVDLHPCRHWTVLLLPSPAMGGCVCACAWSAFDAVSELGPRLPRIDDTLSIQVQGQASPENARASNTRRTKADACPRSRCGEAAGSPGTASRRSGPPWPR